MLKLGRIVNVIAARGTAVVAFGGDDALVSMELPVLQQKTRLDKAYWLPDVDEYVACELDEHAEFGVILGAIYSKADPVPVTSIDKVHFAFRDGTTIEYDRAAHRLAITIAGEAATVSVTADHVHLGGNAGDQLATKTWVTGRFDTHVHPGNGLPPTAVPTVPGMFTDKVRAE